MCQTGIMDESLLDVSECLEAGSLIRPLELVLHSNSIYLLILTDSVSPVALNLIFRGFLIP